MKNVLRIVGIVLVLGFVGYQQYKISSLYETVGTILPVIASTTPVVTDGIASPFTQEVYKSMVIINQAIAAQQK